MDWERIESARARARFMLAIPWFVIAFLVLVPTSEPSFGPTLVLTTSGFEASPPAPGIPIDQVLLAVGVFGMLIGFALDVEDLPRAHEVRRGPLALPRPLRGRRRRRFVARV